MSEHSILNIIIIISQMASVLQMNSVLLFIIYHGIAIKRRPAIILLLHAVFRTVIFRQSDNAPSHYFIHVS